MSPPGLRAHVVAARGDLLVDATVATEPGEVVAVLGPNGAGKTTLLRALAGLTALVAGSVHLDGAVLEEPALGVRRPPEERSLGVVFQDLRLLPHLSALDNVAFGLRARGLARGEARARAAAVLDRADAAHLAALRPAALSGGQAQRVALARALAVEPRLLLLDEPLAAADVAARAHLRHLLRDAPEARAAIRVVVTHDPLEAAALADRIVVIEAGRVVQVGTFAEVTARPRSPWAARMAGLNLLRGEAEPGLLRLSTGAVVVVTGDVRGPALAVISPRAVSLHREPPVGSPRNVLRAHVAEVEPAGDRWRVRLTGAVPLVAEVTAAAGVELHLAEGGAVHATVKATEVDVYPA